jgi:hypothetical protein
LKAGSLTASWVRIPVPPMAVAPFSGTTDEYDW